MGYSRRKFQSTRPRGARLYRVLAWPYLFKFQSTHPRGARLALGAAIGMLGDVSIHAPAWGATWHHPHGRLHVAVSIRAPAWGATAPL